MLTLAAICLLCDMATAPLQVLNGPNDRESIETELQTLAIYRLGVAHLRSQIDDLPDDVNAIELRFRYAVESARCYELATDLFLNVSRGYCR